MEKKLWQLQKNTESFGENGGVPRKGECTYIYGMHTFPSNSPVIARFTRQ